MEKPNHGPVDTIAPVRESHFCLMSKSVPRRRTQRVEELIRNHPDNLNGPHILRIASESKGKKNSSQNSGMSHGFFFFTKRCKEKEFSSYLEISQSLPINQSVSLFSFTLLSQGSMNWNKFLSVSICFISEVRSCPYLPSFPKEDSMI